MQASFSIAPLCLGLCKFSFALLVWTNLAQADERIWMEAKVNGKPARLCFDTGSCELILNSKGASRLGLKFTPPPQINATNHSQIPAGITEACDLEFGGSRMRTMFLVVEPPSALNLTHDGSVGWQAFANQMIRIDASGASVTQLFSLPEDLQTWTKFTVRTNNCIVGLEFTGSAGGLSVICVDTGVPFGVILRPQSWSQWKAAHKKQAMTLSAYYMLGAGLVVTEEMWAKDLSLGSLSLTDVPVMEANRVNVAAGGEGFAANIGLAALKRLDFIIDGKNQTAYLRSKATPSPAYSHNCLGAVFTPRDLVHLQGEDLVARVVDGSPAFEAGIRDGDVLLKYNGIDTTKWLSQPTVVPNFQAAGETIELTLARGKETFTVKVSLKPILSRNPQE